MYLMEHPDEGLRMEKRDQAEALQHIRMAGIRAGDRVLDAGCASGWLTRLIADCSAPGAVVGVDLSQERIALAQQRAQEQGLTNVSFVAGDLTSLPFPDASFDVTFSRYTFEYLREPQAALAELARVTRPGGRVVVADLDGNGVFHYPLPKELEDGLTRLNFVLSKAGFDPYIGRKLFHLFMMLPFARVQVEALPHHLIAGEASAEQLENWETKLRVVRPAALKAFRSAEEYDSFVSACLALLRQRDALSYSVTFMVIGVK